MNLHPPVRSLPLWSLLLLAVVLALPPLSQAAGLRKIGGGTTDFLRAEDAFQLVPSRTTTGVSLGFEITPGYYLYRDRFRFTAEGPGLTVGTPDFPAAGEWKDDPSFGRVKVFHESLTVTVPLKGEGRLRVRWQGCADAGLCYPPQDQVLEVDAKGVVATPSRQGAAIAGTLTGAGGAGVAATVPNTAGASSHSPVSGSLISPSSPTAIASPTSSAPAPESLSAPASTMGPAASPGAAMVANSAVSTPPAGGAGEAASVAAAHAVYGLPGIPTNATQWLVFFFMGLGLSLTPCVLPMLPILAGIVARQHTSSALRGFSLALAYVLGVCTVYGLLGGLVGYFGQQLNLASGLQRPIVLVPFAALFYVLAFSLFGLFELQLPASLASHFHGLSQRQRGGALVGSYVMGLFSSLVVSPCVSAPLFGLLLHVSATGSAVFGATALALLAFGMGVPLLVLGATEGRLLPKSGAWMGEVKTFFGLLLLFVGTELLTRVVPVPVALALYGVCTAATGLWLWRLGGMWHGPGLIARAGGFAALTYAVMLLAGGAAGGDDPLRPLAAFGTSTPASRPTPFVRIHGLDSLGREIARARTEGKVVMLDFYAEWCVSCKIMERSVFRRPDIATRLGRLHLVQADVTANNAEDRALLAHFGLMGPPSILFFDKNGNEMAGARLIGEKDAAGFMAHLDHQGL